QAHKILSQAHTNNTSTADLTIYLHYNNPMDRHCYNLPTVDEIAIILLSDGSVSETMCDIVIRLCSNKLERIHEAHLASTEQNRLRFLHKNQGILYADLYQSLADIARNIANGELSLNNLRRRVILLSIYIGSSYHMFEIYQDSIAITRFYHHPNIFGIMTANPK
ncbi:3719_t:CDS:2, partial [Racocetra persica]